MILRKKHRKKCPVIVEVTAAPGSSVSLFFWVTSCLSIRLGGMYFGIIRMSETPPVTLFTYAKKDHSDD